MMPQNINNIVNNPLNYVGISYSLQRKRYTDTYLFTSNKKGKLCTVNKKI